MRKIICPGAKYLHKVWMKCHLQPMCMYRLLAGMLWNSTNTCCLATAASNKWWGPCGSRQWTFTGAGKPTRVGDGLGQGVNGMGEAAGSGRWMDWTWEGGWVWYSTRWIPTPFLGLILLHGSTWACSTYRAGAGPNLSTVAIVTHSGCWEHR